MDANQLVADSGVARSSSFRVPDPQHQSDTTSGGAPRARQNDDVDWQIVRRVNKGQREAFDLLVLKYQHQVLKILSRYVGNPSDAMDLAQETFIKAYRSLAGFRGDAKFSTWLHRIAVNTAKNYVVSRKRAAWELPLLEGLEGDRELSHNESPEHQLLAEEIRQTVGVAIDELAFELKTAISLRELDGFSYGRIAHEMDCPVGTVRSRIFRAREKISERLEGLLGT